MTQMKLFCFTNISADILIHIFGYNFCIEHYILAHFHSMLLSLKALKIISKEATIFGHQNVGEIDPWSQFH